MSELKSKKKSAHRRMSAGSAPNADMATCGHSHCDSRCRVRYVGAVSHPRDHHILHAARGVANVWTAVVVTGLATVLTGAIAFTSVQAKADSNAPSRAEYMQMLDRVAQMQVAMHDLQTLCASKTPDASVDTSATGTQITGSTKATSTKEKHAVNTLPTAKQK